MSENLELIDNEEAPTSYSSATPAAATNRPAIKFQEQVAGLLTVRH
jgi:hypothetical protein